MLGGAFIAPFLSGSFSLLDAFGFVDGAGRVVFSNLTLPWPKDEVEFALKFSLSAVVFFLALVTDYVNAELPAKRLREFRTKYLDGEYEHHWAKQLGNDCRMNVMYIRRPVWTLWLLPVWEWAWHANHGNGCPDTNLFLFTFQGASGAALKEMRAHPDRFQAPLVHVSDLQQPPSGRLARWFGRSAWKARFSWKAWKDSYFMTNRQIERTNQVVSILSVPILLKTKTKAGATKVTPVGLVNLDATSATGAQLLSTNRQALADHFTQIGTYLGSLR
jgi:hypothetical protein